MMQTKLSVKGRIVPVLAVVLTFFFLLLLSRGFVTSGDDWYFSARNTAEGLSGAFREAVHNAVRHYASLNGRLLGNGSSRFFGTHDMVRELARCTIILVILLQLCRAARVRSALMYLAALLMVVALPSDIYAQSYAWAAGFFNYVPPLMMILAFILRADRVMNGQKDSFLHGFGMFLPAFACQLFVENVTVGFCLLTAGTALWYLAANRRLSWSLSGSLLGAILGCAVMFSAPGYANVNQEGYREVSSTIGELLKVFRTNFTTITMYLTERNWAVILPMSLLGVALLSGKEAGKHPVLRSLAAAALLVCPVWFYAYRKVLLTLSYSQWVAQLSFWLDMAFNLLYLLAVLAAAVLGLTDAGSRRRAVLCIAAVPLIFGPLLVVNPIGPRCMYIPYMLLVCIVLIFAGEWLGRCSADTRKLLLMPVALMTACVLTVYLWTAVWNGYYEHIRISRIQEAMSVGASAVDLPSYPYPAYVHNGNGGAIRYYYYYETPCDLEFRYVPHPDWYGR